MTSARALTGCLTGTAVGDALGLPYENLSPRRRRRMFPDPDQYHFLFGRGMFSDDTEHACMTAQALLVSGGDPERFARSLAWRLKWWLLGCPAGTGRATLKACLKLWVGVPPHRSGVFSAGNGPCMRAPILGVAHGHEPDRLRDLARRSTRVTHTDPKAEHAALAVALAAHLSATEAALPPNEAAERIVAGLDSTAGELTGLIRRAAAAADRETDAFAADLNLDRGVTGYVYHTVPVVVHAWLRHRDDFRSAVLAVIRCGGDTDSTAAIVGGIVGARVGVEGIPEPWRAGLCEWPRNLNWIDRLGRELADGLSEDAPRNAIPANPSGVLARNLV
ncbi:MAG TPA: ADP-ribosylglycohydrolase family protein, partial [Gemmataceae bacterium]|nr:ADP-ribosylglycohydrolase family protein [Gemmataceae bacterium]